MKILAIDGSLRAGSYNRKLVNVAARGALRAGADVSHILLKEFDLPMFDEDLEAQGTPDRVRRLKDLFLDCDGMLVATPEYNGSLSAALKNCIDWMSRPAEGEPVLGAFRNKVGALMATSPGGLGGIRGLTHARTILSGIGLLVIPEQIAVPKAHEAFDGDEIRDETLRASIEGLGERVARLIALGV